MPENTSSFDTIVVGAGVAGLTTSAYLTKGGHQVLLIEKEGQCGGLVNSFSHNGFVFDGGIRALENAGILFPMLRQLGIKMDFVPNDVTVGMGSDVIKIKSEQSLDDYQALLINYFPNQEKEIREITTAMKKISLYMDIQYGIDNPLFLDPVKDGKYFLTDVFPWIFRYAFTSNKIKALNIPVRDYLKQTTTDDALLDIITQHFFTDTPAFFALSYLKLYLDYHYPKRGTGQFTQQLVEYIEKNGGIIHTSTKIVKADPMEKNVVDNKGNQYRYKCLVWAADQHAFYQMIKNNQNINKKTKQIIKRKLNGFQDAKGNDSVLTTYIETELPPEYFASIASSHFFYTPTTAGESIAGTKPMGKSRVQQQQWAEKFLENTTFEIAIPALRNPALAPQGKTGLIVSVLFDYALTKDIESNGWYEQFKILTEKMMVDILDKYIFPDLKNKTSDTFSSTPLSIEQRAGTFQGAITGWSFTNTVQLAENRLTRISNAVKTPFPDIFQAGMWTYSPSGFPVSLITGKIASTQIIKRLKTLET